MKKNLLTPIAAAIAIFGFFSPWVSCGVVKMSGLDLASGGSDKGLGSDMATSNTSGGNSLLWIVPLAAITIIAIYFIYKNKNKVRMAMIPTIIASGLALGIMGVKYMDVKKLNSDVTEKMDEKPKDGTSSEESTGDSSTKELSKSMKNMMSDMVKIEWGFWLTAFAFVGCIVGATQLKGVPVVPVDIAGIPPTLPEDGSKMNQDLGM